jgi:EmrB/QacA subfamily drug resistance transporter
VPAEPVSGNVVGLRSERGPLLGALMLATALVALNQTIVATAVPSVVDDLGGFESFPWLFSVYLLVQAISTPIYGRVSDTLGRKPVMLAGISLFMAGSILCAVAWSMPVLIMFRALQGLGAGAVLPMTNTIAGDVYGLAERAKVQGYLASMWATSAALGPTLGGLLSQYATWRWIFWINIPVGLVAVVIFRRSFDELQTQRKSPPIDYPGAALLSGGCALIILCLLEGGDEWAWTSALSIAILTGGVVLLAAFVAVERRVLAPILPLWVFTRRVLLASSLVASCVGAVLIGLGAYVPTFAQGVLGASPIIAGLTLATLSFGWPAAAALSGRLYLRIGFRLTGLIGCVFVVSGTVLVTIAVEVTSLPLLAGACFVVGGGIGMVAVPALIAAQSSVKTAERGLVTGQNLFFRALGSALAVAGFGAVANASLGSGEAAAAPTGSELAAAAGPIFHWVIVVAIIMVGGVALMPGRSRPRRRSAPSAR